MGFLLMHVNRCCCEVSRTNSMQRGAYLILASFWALRWPCAPAHTLCTLSMATMVTTSWLQASSPAEARIALARRGSTDSSDICRPDGLVSLQCKLNAKHGGRALSQHWLVCMQQLPRRSALFELAWYMLCCASTQQVTLQPLLLDCTA